MEKVNCTNCGTDNKTNVKYCSRCGHLLPELKVGNFDAKAQQETTIKLNKKKNSVGLIVGMITFGIVYYAGYQLFFKSPSIDKLMMTAASEVNKTCPVMVDKETRLDNLIALPGNVIQYNYTLVNVDKSEINADTIKKYIEPVIINNVKTSPQLKLYRDNKSTMVYNYRDKKGIYVLRISVTPDMYQ